MEKRKQKFEKGKTLYFVIFKLKLSVSKQYFQFKLSFSF